MRISKKLRDDAATICASCASEPARARREAIEFAGCMAAWWENDTGPTTVWDVEAEFSCASILLATAARDAIESTDDFYAHWQIVVGFDAGHRYSCALWAEAQAMLIEGWTP